MIEYELNTKDHQVYDHKLQNTNKLVFIYY